MELFSKIITVWKSFAIFGESFILDVWRGSEYASCTSLRFFQTSNPLSYLKNYLKKNFPRYVDRIAESLEQKLKISENLLKQIETLKKKRNESLELHKQTEPKLQVLVKKTKELQYQVM